MWITANDALNRYDGKSIKVYNLDSYFDNCPNLQQGYGFAEDDKTNIYIGSTKGLYIYNRQTNKFSLQKIFKNAPDEIAMPIGFRNGKIYCFNRFFQLASFDVSTKKSQFVKQFSIPTLQSIHVYGQNGHVFYFRYPFIAKNNTIWIIGNKKIESFNLISKKTNEFLVEKNIEIQSSFYDIFDNQILLGTNKGILIFDLSNNKMRLIDKIGTLKLYSIGNICASKDKIVFTNNLKIAFSDKAFKNAGFSKNSDLLKSPMFYQFAFDKSNRLWVCNDSKGQFIIDFKSKLLNKFPKDNEFLNPKTNNSGVSSFSELENGNVLIESHFEFDKKNEKINSPITDVSVDLATRSSKDKFRKGNWIYEEYMPLNKKFRTISFLDKFKKLSKIITINNSDSLGSLKDLQVLQNGSILCSFSTGLYWFIPEQKLFEKVVGVAVPNAFKIELLSKNRVAISYLNNDMIIATILPNNNLKISKKLLKNIQSFYIQEDIVRNRYWIGTNQGIYLLDHNFKLIKKFDANTGLAGTYIYGLLLDDFGNVYCSHQRGLSSIYAYTFQIVNYDKSDGIQDWDFNNRGFYKATDGTLYFGGVNGFNYFKPPLLPKSYYKPEVYIDEIEINNTIYKNDTNPNYIQKLRLNHKQNTISIKAYIKDLQNANSLQLIYKIKETSNNWSRLPNGLAINFSNLAPNNYTLQLGYFDKYANEEVFQKTLLLTISAPFYQENWFLVIVISILTGFIFWIFNRRKLAKQKQKFLQLLELEKQRNKITADLHDEIGSTLSSLQINSTVANKMLQNDTEKAQLILTKIEGQAKGLADKIGDIIWSMKPGKDEFMTLSTRIKNFCNDVLGATEINYKIEIDPKIDTLISDFETRKNVVLITKEAINNALKYSKATQILVSMKLLNNTVTLLVTNNGKGFDPKIVKGNGIGNMQKRASDLNGTLEIVSNVTSGTSIKLEFDVKD